MRFSSVVLPEPLGPIRATKSPERISRFTLRSTEIRSLPRAYSLATFSTTINGFAFMFVRFPASGGRKPPVAHQQVAFAPRSPLTSEHGLDYARGPACRP